jgi:hypothetical protein
MLENISTLSLKLVAFLAYSFNLRIISFVGFLVGGGAAAKERRSNGHAKVANFSVRRSNYYFDNAKH